MANKIKGTFETTTGHTLAEIYAVNIPNFINFRREKRIDIALSYYEREVGDLLGDEQVKIKNISLEKEWSYICDEQEMQNPDAIMIQAKVTAHLKSVFGDENVTECL